MHLVSKVKSISLGLISALSESCLLQVVNYQNSKNVFRAKPFKKGPSVLDFETPGHRSCRSLSVNLSCTYFCVIKSYHVVKVCRQYNYHMWRKNILFFVQGNYSKIRFSRMFFFFIQEINESWLVIIIFYGKIYRLSQFCYLEIMSLNVSPQVCLSLRCRCTLWKQRDHWKTFNKAL